MRYAILRGTTTKESYLVINVLEADPSFVQQSTQQGDLAIEIGRDLNLRVGDMISNSSGKWEKVLKSAAESAAELKGRVEAIEYLLKVARAQLRGAELQWLADLLEPYMIEPFFMPVGAMRWQDAFRLYIFGPEGDISAWVGADLGGYFEQRMKEVEALGGTDDAYLEVFKKMVFGIELEGLE